MHQAPPPPSHGTAQPSINQPATSSQPPHASPSHHLQSPADRPPPPPAKSPYPIVILVVSSTPDSAVSTGTYLTQAYAQISNAIQAYLGAQSIHVTIAAYLIPSSAPGQGRRLQQTVLASPPPAQHFLLGFNVSFPTVAQLATTFPEAAKFAVLWNSQSSQYLTSGWAAVGAAIGIVVLTVCALVFFFCRSRGCCKRGRYPIAPQPDTEVHPLEPGHSPRYAYFEVLRS
ncbi:hypothetical protein WJX73_006801 [Symbiochloris irregularis]|uniref:Uncharacterized protein n=1 Tax=Symbiochloris irregularis TaxID=706552 RepID=A0AAW1P0J0_9CHLO